MVVRFLIAVALALVVACFEPDEPNGTLRCTAGGGCPAGFECRADLRCWRPQPFDAGAPDAGPPACNNNLDDDCDGKIDEEDPGCANRDDRDEHGSKRCDDGIDNDGDGKIDFTVFDCSRRERDPECDKADDDSEE